MLNFKKEIKEAIKKQRVYLVDRRTHKTIELGNVTGVNLGGEINTDLGFEIVFSDKFNITFDLKKWCELAKKECGEIIINEAE